MANEFKVRKGLVVNGSGSVILDVQGSQGQLFSVTDQLSGSLFSVNDISGVPVLEAFSDSTVKIGQYLAEAIIVSGSTARITGSMSLAGFSTGSVLFAGTGGAISQNNSSLFWDNAQGRLGIGTNSPTEALHVPGQVRIGSTVNGYLFNSNTITTYGNIFWGIQADRSFQITDHTYASTYLRINRATGNTSLGSSADAGQRLQVYGDTLLRGSGSTSGTTALTVQNSSSVNLLTVRNDGPVFIHAVGSIASLYMSANGDSSFQKSTSGTNGVVLYGPSSAHHTLTISSFDSDNYYNGALSSLRFSGNFVPSSGATAFSYMLINGTINQTGTSANIVRGLYVNPTLTAATDFRAIEWSNNASAVGSGSWGLYGAGTAPNFLSGSLGIGITTPSSSIHINSSTVNNAFLITTPNNNSTLYPFFIGGVTLTSDNYLRANSSTIEFRRNGTASTIKTVGSVNNLALEGSQHIVFSTNGANERARFTSGGNLLLNDTVDDTFNRLQVTGNARISQALTASLALISGSGSQRLTVQGSGSSILTVDGALGRLFSVDDAASGSLFSVNTISGLPIMEAFSDNTVRIGQFGQRALFVSQSRVGIGKEDSLNATLDVSGSMALTGSFNHQGNYTTTGVITAQTLVISTISSSVVYSSGSNVFGNSLSNTQVLTGSVSITGSLTSNGDVVIRGSGNTSATNALSVQNSDNSVIANFRSDRYAIFGTQISPTGIFVGGLNGLAIYQTNNSINQNVSGQDGFFIGSTSSTNSAYSKLWLGFAPTNGFTNLTATSNIVKIQGAYIPPSGNGNFISLALENNISQSGGANGITRGLYVNPTLTSATDWRSIEWTNNASATSGSWGLYGAGSAPNYLSGSLSIGTTITGSNRLTVSGSTNIIGGGLSVSAPGFYNTTFANTGQAVYNTYAPTGYNSWIVGVETDYFAVYSGRNILYIHRDRNNGNSYLNSDYFRFGSQDNATAQVDINGSTTSRASLRIRSGSAPTSPNDGDIWYSGSQMVFRSGINLSGSAVISQALTASQALISGSGTQRLTVVGSGSAQPLFTVQGSQGELFSIVDSLSGSLFSVNDQSGLPIMEVFSDNTILMGNYLDPMLLTTNRTSSAAGINTIYSLLTSSYDAVYIDYTIRSGSNARAGNFMAMWSGTSVNFTDNSITEFGSTSAFTFGAHVSGANMVVTGSAPTAGWTIKTIIKAI